MESLRNIGYEFSTAVADLIDNSIAADATEVRVDYEFEGIDTWIRIADNGTGMRSTVIDEALRFGTHRDYEDLALGKFGLGLKTASISQCQQLTVASRVSGGRMAIRVWDLDHIRKHDSWELLHPTPSECHPEVTAPLKNGCGTVVFWQKLERILGYQVPAGKAAQTGFKRMCRELEDHLGMVFHRFLTGTAKRKQPLTIYVNGHPVEAWDPFCQDEPNTQTLRAHKLSFQHEGVKSYIHIYPFVLPHESQFSSGRAFKEAGRGQWNALQGFYIYRNDRLLQAGGWNRLRSAEEHVKLARVAVDFPPSADVAFKLNVTKMGISFPTEVREQLGQIVRDVSRRAQDVYRKRDNVPGSKPTPPTAPNPTPATDRPPSTRINPPANPVGGQTGPVAAGVQPPHPTEADPQPSGAPTKGTPPEAPAGATTAGTPDKVSIEAGRQSLASQIMQVLQRELSDDPARLSRLLRALALLDPEFAQAAPANEEAETA
jgi:hypothetical protein